MYTIKELKDLAEKTMIIYKITNLVNKKVYIGQTIRTFNKRYVGAGIGIERVKGTYEMNGNTKNEHLYNSILKYGVKNFKVEILCQCESVEELNKKEKEFIALYNSNDYEKGYNIEVGGDNRRRSLEWRINRILKKEEDIHYFIKLVKDGHIEKDTLFELLNTPVVYIKKNGRTKKYYRYSNIRICCLENDLSVEDGFCMAMRKRDNSRKNKSIYHNVCIAEHEIWFREDINMDKKKFENYNNAKIGRPRTKERKKSKKRKTPQPRAKICPICGKEYKSYSHNKICADCKYEIQKKIYTDNTDNF